MLNKSIAYRLSLFISFAVISVFIAFMIISYSFNVKALRDSAKDKAIGLSTEIIVKIQRYFVTTSEITSNISDQVLYYSQKGDSKIFLESIMQKYPFINGIHVNFNKSVPGLNSHNFFLKRTGDSIFFKQENETIYHCENEKQLYENLIKSEKSTWSEIFRCTKNKNMIVAYFAPIFTEGNGYDKIRIGEIICELSLMHFNDLLNNQKIGERGYAFLMAKDGLYLTHPLDEYAFKMKVQSLPEYLYDRTKVDIDEVLEKGLTGTLIAYPDYLNREKSWVYYTQMNEINWFLVFVLPYSELFEPLFISMLKMLFFAVLGILMIYLIITLITNRLIQPLSDVTTRLQKFSKESEQDENDTLNEVLQVANSLNNIKSRYEQYKLKETENEEKSQRYQSDLLLASEIQESLIKTNFPAFPNRTDIDLYAIYKPAKGISGDLFDYFFLDEENLLFTIGDVSGKGIPAAIFMSIAQTVIKNNTSGKTAKRIVNNTNMELYTKNQHQFFVTLFLGILNVKTGVLNFCNAAHTTTLILKSDGNIVELNQTHGLPLGLYSDNKYSDSKITIESGDSILLYTDGVTELQEESRQQFGYKRFKGNLNHLANQTPKEMVNRIDKSLTLFRGNSIQNDDITLMAIKFQA